MKALGFLETIGLVAAVEAADSALKAASVTLAGKKSVGGGMYTVILTGDVAAVKAAVETGAAAAAAIGRVVSAQVIARPHDDMLQVIETDPMIKGGAPGMQKKAAAPAKAAPKGKTPGI